MFAVLAPGDPGGGPFVARDPDPAAAMDGRPAAVVVGGPAEGFVGDPGPAAVGAGPAADGVGTPAGGVDDGWLEDVAVFGGFEPGAVGGKGFVKGAVVADGEGAEGSIVGVAGGDGLASGEFEFPFAEVIFAF